MKNKDLINLTRIKKIYNYNFNISYDVIYIYKDKIIKGYHDIPSEVDKSEVDKRFATWLEEEYREKWLGLEDENNKN